MASLSKRNLNSLCATLLQGNFNISWQHLVYNFITYIVQLYEEKCAILQIVWGVGPCSQEQLFQLSSANTARTIGEFAHSNLVYSLGIGADVLDLTGQNADTFGKLHEENTWFELTTAQKQYMDMVQNVNDYIKNEYHAIHTFLWKSGYSGMGNTMPKR